MQDRDHLDFVSRLKDVLPDRNQMLDNMVAALSIANFDVQVYRSRCHHPSHTLAIHLHAIGMSILLLSNLLRKRIPFSKKTPKKIRVTCWQQSVFHDYDFSP